MPRKSNAVDKKKKKPTGSFHKELTEFDRKVTDKVYEMVKIYYPTQIFLSKKDMNFLKHLFTAGFHMGNENRGK